MTNPIVSALAPKMHTVAPPDGAGIYLKRTPNGQVALKFRRGVEFHPDQLYPNDVSVLVLLELINKMKIPGCNPQGLFPSLRDFAPENGIGILVKREADGQIGIRIENPSDVDHPDNIVPAEANLKQLYDWLLALMGRR